MAGCFKASDALKRLELLRALAEKIVGKVAGKREAGIAKEAFSFATRMFKRAEAIVVGQKGLEGGAKAAGGEGALRALEQEKRITGEAKVIEKQLEGLGKRALWEIGEILEDLKWVKAEIARGGSPAGIAGMIGRIKREDAAEVGKELKRIETFYKDLIGLLDKEMELNLEEQYSLQRILGTAQVVERAKLTNDVKKAIVKQFKELKKLTKPGGEFGKFKEYEINFHLRLEAITAALGAGNPTLAIEKIDAAMKLKIRQSEECKILVHIMHTIKAFGDGQYQLLLGLIEHTKKP